MKTKIIIILSIIIAFLLTLFIWQYSSLNNKYQTLVSNYKASMLRLDSVNTKCIEYKLSVDLLSYYSDSIMQAMDSIRKELKIKDKNLERMAYITTSISKTDTVYFKEPIFINNLELDTVILDKWHKLSLSLTYPDEICVEPEFTSSMHITTYTKKETINKPKKFFLFRLFLKKHTVTRVTTTEENPYITIKDNIFIDIL